MNACPSCGRDNPEDARFCNACGAALAAASAQPESRKVVTILFCDLVGSTSLGESSDPEALRARMRRYFEDLRAILERHGGTVEKFVGDAVMAVFGIPVAHEDDALRAVRASIEMQEAVAAHGLCSRIGVNTGEVVVGGESETLVTGDAVNVAARLEQAAAAGEILIGAETRLLVRDAVRVEQVEPLALKGKSEPVEAFRLLEVLAGAAPIARHLDSPLVGRERERLRLWRTYEDAVADRTCQLFTLLGPAGIGKSRLVADFLERVDGGADVLHGRCLHYGEGITYWPLVELLLATGVDPETVLGSSAAETQLAFRRLLEARAAERTQIVLLDDLHWAEPPFLELVEHVADLSRAAPIFLLCVARTELLDRRPGWAGGKLNATSLLLEPLGAEDCDRLIANLLEDASLDDDARERIVATSEGNPLFVEEMLAMVRDRAGGSEIVVPPTIHALLQARLDALDSDQRLVIERGSVEGQVFHRGAVAELSPPPLRAEVGSHLSTLVRKELIRPDSAALSGDEAYRFRHLLIRDAAYESLPKATRAELHEQFANWLGQQELVERDEILGYHYEQAHRYRSELDPGDPALALLARRASDHLAAAGRTALNHGDFHGARALLGRAANVLPQGDEQRLALAPELARALLETGDARFLAVLNEARAAADPLIRARAAATLAAYAFSGEAELTGVERQRMREEARAAFEAAGDDGGMAMYWWAVSQEESFACQGANAVAAGEKALTRLRRSGDPMGLVLNIRERLVSGYVFSAIPVDIGLRRLAELAGSDTGPLVGALTQAAHALLLSMKGDLERARQLAGAAGETFHSAGRLLIAGNARAYEARIEMRAGDLAQAERALREGLDILEALGDSRFYPTLAAELAMVLYEQGRYAEVREWHARARATSGADDLVNFLFIDFVEVGMLARDGRHAEAEELGARIIAGADTTDYYWPRTCSRGYLAEARALAGRMDEARVLGLAALEVVEAKGDVLLAARVREQLAAVGVDL